MRFSPRLSISAVVRNSPTKHLFRLASQPPPPTSSSPLSSLHARSSLIAQHFQGSSSQYSTTTSPSPSQSTATMPYGVRRIGQANTLDHRVYLEQDGQPISPFHDIPLYANEQRTILNMVVEIPRCVQPITTKYI